MKTIPNLPFVQLMPFCEISDARPAWLVTSQPAWEAVRNQLSLDFVDVLFPQTATITHWDELLFQVRHEAGVVYAVGGGLVADAGKYLASRRNLPLVVLPTALSVDAFLTSASGIRQGGCVRYIQTCTPHTLILDLQVIAAAPAWIRAAGITDVLSIATGCWDWKFAEERGQNPAGMELIPWAYENAQSILRGVLDCAEAAGEGDLQGLKTLFDCLAMEVQLCNQLGHSRPEEGSEHYFAYCVENHVGHGWPHGDLVGSGILAMVEFQGLEAAPLKAALQACHIPVDRVPAEVKRQVMIELPQYVRKHQLPFGIAHQLSLAGQAENQFN
jgi:glycerol-1-phosphate dehydrogenase [NAD(P)+]